MLRAILVGVWAVFNRDFLQRCMVDDQTSPQGVNASARATHLGMSTSTSTKLI